MYEFVQPMKLPPTLSLSKWIFLYKKTLRYALWNYSLTRLWLECYPVISSKVSSDSCSALWLSLRSCLGYLWDFKLNSEFDCQVNKKQQRDATKNRARADSTPFWGMSNRWIPSISRLTSTIVTDFGSVGVIGSEQCWCRRERTDLWE